MLELDESSQQIQRKFNVIVCLSFKESIQIFDFTISNNVVMDSEKYTPNILFCCNYN